jgi:hypothetical protein
MPTFTKNKVTKRGEVGVKTPDAAEDVGEEERGTAGVEERTKEREEEASGEKVLPGDEHLPSQINR